MKRDFTTSPTKARVLITNLREYTGSVALIRRTLPDRHNNQLFASSEKHESTSKLRVFRFASC